MSSRTGAFKNKGSGLDNHKIWIRIRSLGQPNGWRSTNTWLEVWDVVSNVPKPTQSQGKWTKDYILRKKISGNNETDISDWLDTSSK